MTGSTEGNKTWIPSASVICPHVVHFINLQESATRPKTQTDCKLMIQKRIEWCPGAESNHRHEDFQSGFNFYNLIKSATYALPISVCASKCQLLPVIRAQIWHINLVSPFS